MNIYEVGGIAMRWVTVYGDKVTIFLLPKHGGLYYSPDSPANLIVTSIRCSWLLGSVYILGIKALLLFHDTHPTVHRNAMPLSLLSKVDLSFPSLPGIPDFSR